MSHRALVWLVGGACSCSLMVLKPCPMGHSDAMGLGCERKWVGDSLCQAKN